MASSSSLSSSSSLPVQAVIHEIRSSLEFATSEQYRQQRQPSSTSPTGFATSSAAAGAAASAACASPRNNNKSRDPTFRHRRFRRNNKQFTSSPSNNSSTCNSSSASLIRLECGRLDPSLVQRDEWTLRHSPLLPLPPPQQNHNMIKMDEEETSSTTTARKKKRHDKRPKSSSETSSAKRRLNLKEEEEEPDEEEGDKEEEQEETTKKKKNSRHASILSFQPPSSSSVVVATLRRRSPAVMVPGQRLLLSSSSSSSSSPPPLQLIQAVLRGEEFVSMLRQAQKNMTTDPTQVRCWSRTKMSGLGGGGGGDIKAISLNDCIDHALEQKHHTANASASSNYTSNSRNRNDGHYDMEVVMELLEECMEAAQIQTVESIRLWAEEWQVQFSTSSSVASFKKEQQQQRRRRSSSRMSNDHDCDHHPDHHHHAVVAPPEIVAGFVKACLELAPSQPPRQYENNNKHLFDPAPFQRFRGDRQPKREDEIDDQEHTATMASTPKRLTRRGSLMIDEMSPLVHASSPERRTTTGSGIASTTMTKKTRVKEEESPLADQSNRRSCNSSRRLKCTSSTLSALELATTTSPSVSVHTNEMERPKQKRQAALSSKPVAAAASIANRKRALSVVDTSDDMELPPSKRIRRTSSQIDETDRTVLPPPSRNRSNQSRRRRPQTLRWSDSMSPLVQASFPSSSHALGLSGTNLKKEEEDEEEQPTNDENYDLSSSPLVRAGLRSSSIKKEESESDDDAIDDHHSDGGRYDDDEEGDDDDGDSVTNETDLAVNNDDDDDDDDDLDEAVELRSFPDHVSVVHIDDDENDEDEVEDKCSDGTASSDPPTAMGSNPSDTDNGGTLIGSKPDNELETADAADLGRKVSMCFGVDDELGLQQEQHEEEVKEKDPALDIDGTADELALAEAAEQPDDGEESPTDIPIPDDSNENATEEPAPSRAPPDENDVLPTDGTNDPFVAICDDDLLFEKVVLYLALQDRLSSRGPSVPPSRVMVKGFRWGDYSACENVLYDSMARYYKLSKAYIQRTKEQREYNKSLVDLIRKTAKQNGWRFHGSFSEKDIRDRIRCFYKTHLQNSKKKVKYMIKNRNENNRDTLRDLIEHAQTLVIESDCAAVTRTKSRAHPNGSKRVSLRVPKSTKHQNSGCRHKLTAMNLLNAKSQKHDNNVQDWVKLSHVGLLSDYHGIERKYQNACKLNFHRSVSAVRNEIINIIDVVTLQDMDVDWNEEVGVEDKHYEDAINHYKKLATAEKGTRGNARKGHGGSYSSSSRSVVDESLPVVFESDTNNAVYDQSALLEHGDKETPERLPANIEFFEDVDEYLEARDVTEHPDQKRPSRTTQLAAQKKKSVDMLRELLCSLSFIEEYNLGFGQDGLGDDDGDEDDAEIEILDVDPPVGDSVAACNGKRQRKHAKPHKRAPTKPKAKKPPVKPCKYEPPDFNAKWNALNHRVPVERYGELQRKCQPFLKLTSAKSTDAIRKSIEAIIQREGGTKFQNDDDNEKTFGKVIRSYKRLADQEKLEKMEYAEKRHLQKREVDRYQIGGRRKRSAEEIEAKTLLTRPIQIIQTKRGNGRNDGKDHHPEEDCPSGEDCLVCWSKDFLRDDGGPKEATMIFNPDFRKVLDAEVDIPTEEEDEEEACYQAVGAPAHRTMLLESLRQASLLKLSELSGTISFIDAYNRGLIPRPEKKQKR